MILQSVSINQFCKEWLDTWSGNKPKKLLDFYHPQALYLDPANKTGLKGLAEIEPYFKKLLAANPDWKWEAIEIFETPKGFTLKWKAMIPVKNEILIEYGLDIVELLDGKIIRNEVYFDRSDWINLLKK
jgi:hypothetical protein